MTIGRKVTDRKQAIMVYMRVKCQHQRWTLLHDPHAGMTMAMNPAFVAFGTLEPTLQVQIVDGQISRLAPSKQPWLKAAHHLGEMLVDGVGTGLPRLLQGDEPRLTLIHRGRGARPQRVIHRLQVLGVEAHVLQNIA
jgi:hypothetical protein